ncbi:MAG: ABC transporter substrate-binding protein [Pseudomonadota bacterium]
MRTSVLVHRQTYLFATAAVALPLSLASAADDTLKIGALGVMSGPYAGWGGVMSQTAQTLADLYSADGGIEIGDRTYDIEIISVDTRADPRTAVTGAERLIHEEGVKYILGPNVDTTAASVKPVMEAGNAINVPYAFSKDLYTPPASNSILGMVASYQVAPFIYEYLRDEENIESVSFLAANAADPLNQRAEALSIAEKLGLEIVASEDTYEPGATDFFPIMTKVLSAEPDLIVLSGVSPADAGPLIRTARELGYEGFLSTETGQDPAAISEVAGDAADGFIAAGGASTEAIRSEFMVEFIDRYIEMWGEWNDVAALFVYAPEIILQTLQAAGPEAIDDIEVFKTTLARFEGSNPFVNTEMILSYVGEEDFGQARQISVPIVVQTIQDGNFVPLFVARLSD